MNHRHLGGLFLLVLLSSAFLFARIGDATARAAGVTIHMVLAVLVLLGFVSLGLARHRGRGPTFVLATSLAAVSSLLGVVGVALGRTDGAAWILAHVVAGAAATFVLGYRWLVTERKVPAARIAGIALVFLVAAACVGRCRATEERPPASPSPSPPSSAAVARAAPRDDLVARLGEERSRQIRTVIDSMRRTGRPPEGVVQGGRRGVFENRERRLPRQRPGYYRESDIWPRSTGGRGAERLVFGRRGEVYYSRDHYKTFIEIEGAP